MNNITEFLDSLGLGWKYILNGILGGVIWSIYKKSPFWDSVRQVCIGGVVAGYVTPILMDKASMSTTFSGFCSFVIGMIGMVVLDSIYKWGVKKVRLLFS